MRIGVSTASFYPRVTTEDSLDIMKKLGFNICEAFLETEGESSEDYAFMLKEKAEKLGIEVHSVHAFSPSFEPFLFDSYERRRKEMENRFEKVCKAASILGAEHYTFHGMRNMPGKTIDIEKVSIDLDNLCSIAEFYNVKVALENVSRCKGGNIEFLKEIKKYMKKSIYYTLDLKQARRNEIDPKEYLEIYGKNIKTVHINDGDETSTCLLPGKGNVNLDAIISEISKIDENIPYIIEVYGDNYSSFNEIKEAREYIESLEVVKCQNYIR